MAVRKRIWTTRNGESREAWVVDYTDHTGKRRFETFIRKGEADSRAATIKVELGKGRHVALDSKATIADIAENWIRRVEAEGRERATVTQYRQHLKLHILPHLGRIRLAKLTPERIEAYRDQYLLGKDGNGREGMSRAMARKVLVSLKSLLKSAKCGHLADGIRIALDERGKRKLEIGRDVPGNAEIKRLFDATAGNAKSRRTIPLEPGRLIPALKEWKLACPKSEPDLVFPTRTGAIDSHKNMLRGLAPVMRATGVVHKNGEPKYALH